MLQTLFRHRFELAYGKLAAIRSVIASKAKALGLEPGQIQNINLVCDEYCANLLEHQKKVATHVTISIGKSGTDYIFTISDNGSPWQQLEQQLKSAELPTDPVESGMGLALIRATLPDFDYRIEAAHNQIRFRLPAHKPRRQIVIVDDSPSQLSLLARFLEEDYQLALFSQASEALVWLTNNHCDLVLTDLHMPDINGFDFRRKVAAIPHHQLLPFIFLSGDTLTDTLTTAAQSGIDDFLAKPINKPHLLTVLERVLERHRHLVASFEAQIQQQLTAPLSQTAISPLAPPLQLLLNQEPATSGDFVMQRQMQDGSKLLILGDQMGHGLVAKANGSACFGFICGLLQNPELTPEQLFTALNSHLYQAREATSLICLLLVHISADNKLRLYNAGMPCPVLISRHSQFIEPAMGLLGLFEEIDTSGWETQLAPGDSLHCYSDGLVEGQWPDKALDEMQGMSPQQRHHYLWQHHSPSAVDDRSLISLFYQPDTGGS